MGIKLRETLSASVPTQAMFKKQEVEANNPSLFPCSVRIMAIDTIANRIKFSEDSALQALPTLSNIPLVTLYKEEIDDFGDHEMYKDETGKYRYRTYGIGVIPESASQWIERVEDSSGNERLYLCSDAILWKRQHREFAKIQEMEQMSVSMEVQITSGKFSEDKILEVDNFYFTAIAVLGETVTPAFREAMISTFTESDEYQVMMSELKEYMNQFEGGKGMPKANFTPEPAEPATDPVQAPEGGQPTEPSQQTSNPEPASTPEPQGNPEDPKPADPTDPKEGDDNPVTDNAIEDLRKEMAKAEAEYGRTIAGLETEKTELHSQLQQLQAESEAKIKSLNDELESLREFKANIEKEQRKAFRDGIIERFGDLQDNDEFKELLTKMDEMSPQDVEDKCYAIVGRQARARKTPKAPTPTRIPVTNPNNTPRPKDDGYGGLLLKKRH